MLLVPARLAARARCLKKTVELLVVNVPKNQPLVTNVILTKAITVYFFKT